MTRFPQDLALNVPRRLTLLDRFGEAIYSSRSKEDQTAKIHVLEIHSTDHFDPSKTKLAREFVQRVIRKRFLPRTILFFDGSERQC